MKSFDWKRGRGRGRENQKSRSESKEGAAGWFQDLFGQRFSAPFLPNRSYMYVDGHLYERGSDKDSWREISSSEMAASRSLKSLLRSALSQIDRDDSWRDLPPKDFVEEVLFVALDLLTDADSEHSDRDAIAEIATDADSEHPDNDATATDVDSKHPDGDAIAKIAEEYLLSLPSSGGSAESLFVSIRAASSEKENFVVKRRNGGRMDSFSLKEWAVYCFKENGRLSRVREVSAHERRQDPSDPHVELLRRVESCEKKMASVLRLVIQFCRNKGVFLTPDGRIDPDSFPRGDGYRALSPQETDMLNRKKQNVLRDREYRELGDPEDAAVARASDLFEQLVSVIFTKILPDRFIAVRASEYDDLLYGVDTVIYDLESKEVLGSFDEALTRERLREGEFPRNKEYILYRNGSNVSLRHAFSESDDGSFVLKRIYRDVPLCCLSFPVDQVLETIEAMRGRSLNIATVSAEERDTCIAFIDQIHIFLGMVIEKIIEEEKQLAAAGEDFLTDATREEAWRIDAEVRSEVLRKCDVFRSVLEDARGSVNQIGR